MSISIAIIGLVIIALFVLPFFLVGVGKNKGQKHLKQALLKIAEEHSCNISEYELWTSSAIGIDETTNNLFFVHLHNDIETAKHIKLSDFRICKINNYSRVTKDREGNHTAIDRLELELTPFEKVKPVTILEFFNADDSKLYSNELMMVEKWAQIINEKLNLKK